MSDTNCPYCDVVMDSGGAHNARTKDHFYPLSRGGRVTIYACRKCNGDKANLSPKEWLAVLVGRNDPRAKNVGWFLAQHAGNIDAMEAASKQAIMPISVAAETIALELAPYLFNDAPFDDCTDRQKIRLTAIGNSIVAKLAERGLCVMSQGQVAA